MSLVRCLTEDKVRDGYIDKDRFHNGIETKVFEKQKHQRRCHYYWYNEYT